MGFKLCSVGTKGALGKYPPTIDTKQDASTLTYPVTRSPLTSGIKRAFSPENCCSLNIFSFSVYFSINPQDGCGKNPRVDQHKSEVLTFAYLALTTVSCSKLTWKHMPRCIELWYETKQYIALYLSCKILTVDDNLSTSLHTFTVWIKWHKEMILIWHTSLF